MSTMGRLGFFVAAAVVALTSRTDGRDVTLQSRAVPTELAIDGHLREWSSLDPVTKGISGVVANDKGRLVLAFATSDPEVILRMRLAGLLIYIDGKGGKSQDLAIRLPPMGRPSVDRAPLEPVLSYFEVLGPRDSQRRAIERGGDRPPNAILAEVGQRDGVLGIELSVPFVADPATELGMAVKSGNREIGVGLQTPDVPRQAQVEGGGRRGGGPPGGGGRGPGGPGGMGPGLGSGKSIKVWIKTRLAERL